jgi:D-alanyl-lipoteichoic acid acyltransferase DltB (MBOAT superfamily)
LISSERFQSGLLLVFRGLTKKIVIADLLAALGVDAVFAAPAEYSSLTLLLALYGYSFQIYNDFSGYSDIAIGAARMMGYDLPMNFNRPYLATNVREFWTRWHITLSTWLRDYLYIPLGGNQGSKRTTTRNLADCGTAPR